MTKATANKKTMMLRVERDRMDYAKAHGDPEPVRVDEPLGVDLELTGSYARDLRDMLKTVLTEHAGHDFECAQLTLDVPIRLYLRPLQMEQLIERLAEVPCSRCQTAALICECPAGQRRCS